MSDLGASSTPPHPFHPARPHRRGASEVDTTIRPIPSEAITIRVRAAGIQVPWLLAERQKHVPYDEATRLKIIEKTDDFPKGWTRVRAIMYLVSKSNEPLAPADLVEKKIKSVMVNIRQKERRAREVKRTEDLQEVLRVKSASLEETVRVLAKAAENSMRDRRNMDEMAAELEDLRRQNVRLQGEVVSLQNRIDLQREVTPEVLEAANDAANAVLEQARRRNNSDSTGDPGSELDVEEEEEEAPRRKKKKKTPARRGRGRRRATVRPEE